MGMKLFAIIFAFVAISEAIPMAFRKETPADETLPFAPYRDDVDGKDYRLPNNTIPIRYDISLTTDVHRGETAFTGTVKITIEAVISASEITIHHRQITIEKINLLSSTSALLQENVNFDEVDDLEFLVIRPTNPLIANQRYIIEISYRGSLRDDNMGFYRSSYRTPEGHTVWLATTQFEQTDARHAFPCYDEPQIRAVFGVEIKHDQSYSAISNMPGVTTNEVDTNYAITKFEDTEPVQSYLIAFVVSDFKYINNSDPIQQRVFAKAQSIDNGEGVLGLDAGKKLLDEFQAHLGVTYNLPKMDQVAVPDFDAGAMENWGLVTYREEYLLYNEAIATTRQRETIITIISHEYAHQWFGNHVSPKWWSYLWLNEGFATLYENYLASLVYPEDRLMDTFVIDTVQSVLDVDASPSIRPMTHYVESPERITGLFDRVAYDKSGSVLRMMQVALGVNTFTKGLRYYLNAKEYQSASSDDLYTSLQLAVNEDYPTNPPSVTTIMQTWENQAGYPVITVSLDGDVLTLTQERFFYTEETSTNLWWVPINYVVGSNPDFNDTKPDIWIPGVKTQTIGSNSQKPFTSDDWVIVNIQESSYYRVNYDDNLWNLLIEQLRGDEHNKIHLLNRAQLVDDSLNLARAGKISYDIPFGILEYLQKESDYIPWASANRGMTLLNRWLSGSTAYENYQAFVRRIVEPLYDSLGIEVVASEQKLNRYARSIAINLACQAGLEVCLKETSEKLNEVVASGAQIAPDLQSAIYCNGLRQANSSTYFYLQNKMLQSENQAERTLIIAALGCSQDDLLLTQLLNLAITPGDALRLQEKFRVFAAPINNGALGLRVLMNFLRYNFHAVRAVSATQVNTILNNIAPRISSQEILDEFESLLSFLTENGGISEVSGDNLRTAANSNLKWQEKHLDEIAKWLQGYSTETTTIGAGSLMISTIAITFCAVIKYFL